MIVACEKCSKQFNIRDNLIPETGRLLQCGSCNHKWFYKLSVSNEKKKIIEKIIETTIPEEKKEIQKEEIKENNKTNRSTKKVQIY